MALPLHAGATQVPLEVLQRERPGLYQLFQQGRTYTAALEKYAHGQGFRAPFESAGTVVHELIHIFSAIHQGYFIDGTYYEPYVLREHWPSPTNAEIAQYLQPEEKGLIYTGYVRNTPQNHLGNVVDELNAYSQVAPFICRNEAASAAKQVRNMTGLLHLQEAYLRVTRLKYPSEFRHVAHNAITRGAVASVAQNTWKALRECGQAEAQIPRAETSHFLSLP